MFEILAPAGDAASFSAAVNSGADAVYLGLTDFSARKSAANFSLGNLKEYIDRAHVLQVKVYVALNTLVKDGELDRFFECVLGAWNAGADALIIQDMFLGKKIKETYPEIVLHLSTQAGVCNVYGARMAKRYGFSRVILARETPSEGIAAIAREIETEVFVQGALCTCFSGQCYLSAFAGGNSGNRGMCKQPCRKLYRLDAPGREALSYKLSLSDLNVGEDIKKLAAAGVASFKIEGRMRSAAYVGAAVKYYRDIADGTGDSKKDLSDLKRAYNRGDYTKGYAFGQDKSLISSSLQGHKGEKVGQIAGGKSLSGKLAFVRSAYRPSDGDGFKVIRGDTEIGGGVFSASFPKVSGGFCLPSDVRYRPGDGVYLTSDTALAQRVAARKKTVPVRLSIYAAEGERLRVRASGGFGSMEFDSGFAAEKAKTHALGEEDLAECFLKTDAYPFDVLLKSVKAVGRPFAVKSALNAFRREVYEGIYRRLAGNRPQSEPRPILKKEGRRLCFSDETAVIDDDFSWAKQTGAKIGISVFAPKNYRDIEEIRLYLDDSKYYARYKYLYLPAFMTDADVAAVCGYAARFDGVYAEGAWAAEFCRQYGIPLFAGTGFNLFNSESAAVLSEEDALHCAAVSKELSSKEAGAMPEAYRLAGGAVKVMELGHCPFGKNCGGCEGKDVSLLTDERGRAFTLRRCKNSTCRFELFNCLPLAKQKVRPALYDFRTLSAIQKQAYIGEGARDFPATAGLSVTGVQ